MPIRRTRRQAFALSIGAALLFAGLGTFPLLGAPGFLALEVVNPILAMMAPGSDLFPRDTLWPFALGVTWLLGALIPLCWMLTRPLYGAARGLAFVVSWAALAVAGTLSMYWFGIAGS